MWVAKAIASAPVLAIQGTLRAVWMAHEATRKEALAQMSTLVLLGTDVREHRERPGRVPERPPGVAPALAGAHASGLR